MAFFLILMLWARLSRQTRWLKWALESETHINVKPTTTHRKILSDDDDMLGLLRDVCAAALLPLAPPPSSPPSRTLLRCRPLLLLHAISSSLPPVPEMGEVPYKIDAREGIPLHAALLRHGQRVKRFADLSSDETRDLWVTAKDVGVQLEQYHKASSFTFAIQYSAYQDGPQAGQTVPHVHIHVIPRKKGDFEKNDEIYDAAAGDLPLVS
uniref:HIT domain-containing protein n=1 Tax=Oryza punctata TaxID=4537 RepID=A0A0E0LYQ6_ORYPU